MFKSSPDQWSLLKSLVELGSLAQVAKAHNRSQPAVSYQLQQLQEQLGVNLLELSGRQLQLTDHGRELLERASALLDGWSQLEQHAKALAAGERSVISLVIDSIFPKSWLANALKQFHQHYPQIQVHIKEVLRDESRIQHDLRAGDLYLVNIPEFAEEEKQWVMDIRFQLVASASHSLFSVPEALRQTRLETTPLIQVIDKDRQQAVKYQTGTRESWYFTSIESAIEAVRSQLGYGWLPLRYIQPLLDSGELRIIDPGKNPPRITRLYIVRAEECRHDPAIACLHESLLESVRESSV